MSALTQTVGLLKHHKMQFALATAAGAAMIVAGIGLMSSSGYLISRAAERPPILDLILVIVTVRFFALSRAALRYAERLLSHDLTFKLLLRIRRWFYERLEPLAPARLFSRHSGDLLTRIVSDVETLQNVYLRLVAPCLIAALVSLATFAGLHYFSAQLAWVTLAFLAVTGVALPLAVKHASQRLGEKLVRTRATLSRHLVETSQGIEDVLAFGLEGARGSQAAATTHEILRLQKRQASIAAWQAGAASFLANAGMWTILALAIPIVSIGEIPGVCLTLLALGVLSSFESVQPLASALQSYEPSRVAAERLHSIIAEPPAVVDPPKPRRIPSRPIIEFEDVTFTYDHDGLQPSIRDVSFTLEPGKHLALIGASGSGKSTLAHLLVRFWDPQQGRILLAGNDLREYSIDDVRGAVTLISQHTHIFNTTLRHNLLLARPDATDARLYEALELAQLTDFVQHLPRGLDTFAGEQGARLSGGERQRIALARALLRNAPILVLDEPTAHLDATNELLVIAAIRKVAASRSTLFITHRLVRLGDYDEILILDAGRLRTGNQRVFLGD